MNSGDRVHAGNLHEDTSKSDIFDLFARFGKVVFVDKRKYFAFVQFESSRDAERATNELNGYLLKGNKITVEVTLPRGATGMSERVCYVCQQPGHKAMFCPHVKQHDRNTCFICGQPGHISKYCPYKQGSGGMERREFDPRFDPRPYPHYPPMHYAPYRHSPPPYHRSPPPYHHGPPSYRRSPGAYPNYPQDRHRSPAMGHSPTRRSFSPQQRSRSQSPRRRSRTPPREDRYGRQSDRSPLRSDRLSMRRDQDEPASPHVRDSGRSDYGYENRSGESGRKRGNSPSISPSPDRR